MLSSSSMAACCRGRHPSQTRREIRSCAMKSISMAPPGPPSIRAFSTSPSAPTRPAMSPTAEPPTRRPRTWHGTSRVCAPLVGVASIPRRAPTRARRPSTCRTRSSHWTWLCSERRPSETTPCHRKSTVEQIRSWSGFPWGSAASLLPSAESCIPTLSTPPLLRPRTQQPV